MTSNTLIGFGSTIVGIFIGALILQFATKWVAGFKPKYLTALLAVFISCLACYAIGFLAGYCVVMVTKTPLTGAALVFIMVICFFVQTGFYTLIIKDSDHKPLAYGKACLALLIQIIFAAAILAATSGISEIMVSKNVKTNAVANDVNTSTVAQATDSWMNAGFPDDNSAPQTPVTAAPDTLSFSDQLAARWSGSENKAEQKQVAAGLKIFDLSLSYEPDPVNGTNYVELTTLRGRIKNDSPKNITSLTLKILIFDSNTNQIDTIPVLVCGSLTGYNLLPQINSNEVKSFYVFARGGNRIPTGFSFTCVVDGDKLEFPP